MVSIPFSPGIYTKYLTVIPKLRERANSYKQRGDSPTHSLLNQYRRIHLSKGCWLWELTCPIPHRLQQNLWVCPTSAPKMGSSLGSQATLSLPSTEEKVAETSPAPRAQPENLVLACFPTSFGCLTCNK